MLLLGIGGITDVCRPCQLEFNGLDWRTPIRSTRQRLDIEDTFCQFSLAAPKISSVSCGRWKGIKPSCIKCLNHAPKGESSTRFTPSARLWYLAAKIWMGWRDEDSKTALYHREHLCNRVDSIGGKLVWILSTGVQTFKALLKVSFPRTRTL